MSDPNKIFLKKVKAHNLKNVSLSIDKGKFVVFTGVSGSGKSTLAFDTIHAEGLRRYLETLSHSTRHHLSELSKPDAQQITGMAPTIAIEQKTVGKTPRSTVGTLTGIYDHLRVLYARVGIPHCPISGEPVQPQSTEKIVQKIQNFSEGTRLIFLSSFIKNKKGECREDLSSLLKRGFTRVRVDGEIIELSGNDALNPKHSHTIDIVIDRIKVTKQNKPRIQEAASLALEEGKGYFSVLDLEKDEEIIFSNFAFSEKSNLSYGPLDPRDFSFNNPTGMCPTCHGLAIFREFDLQKILSEDLSISEDCCKVAGHYDTVRYGNIYRNLAKLYKFKVTTPWKKLSKEAKEVFLYGTKKKWTEMVFSHPKKKQKWTEYVRWRGVLFEAHTRFNDAKSEKYKEKMLKLMHETICVDCKGARIKPYPAATKLQGKKIHELTSCDLLEVDHFFKKLILSKEDELIAKELLKEIKRKLQFLLDIGLQYLTLDRSAPTLSGGEAQRVRLASQIGIGLVGSIYILDEPSIGLHSFDHQRLVHSLLTLRDRGNSVLVVEHDRETIEQADIVIDVGPKAGKYGGEILSCGSLKQLLSTPRSLTAQYLTGKKQIKIPKKRKLAKHKIKIVGATHHNLKNVTVEIPLGGLICVTGVSGSGKSSLISDVLYPALSNQLQRSTLKVGNHKKIEGINRIDKVIYVDQSPIGKTIRSNPGTYIKLFDDVRNLFAELAMSKMKGFTPGHFSFNVKEGSCNYCSGIGKVKVDMDFLEDAWVECIQCKGKRFDTEVLSIQFKGKNIYDLLEMDIEEALILFETIPNISRKLQLLKKVGLDYLKIGQPSPTLSGGEAQRIKLARELVRPSSGKTLYIFDEPTTGLHFYDIQKLLDVLHELIDLGNTAIVIEHNLDFIKTADWIIDLGPFAGRDGGKINGVGSPETIAKLKTPTGISLSSCFKEEKITPSIKKTKKLQSKDLYIENASQNNLKKVSLSIPRNKVTIFTGPSGSGKTSLAFDTIYAEGQRRYVETLPSYVRQFTKMLAKPKVEKIEGLSPTIAIEQKKGALNPRSTVGTLTEVYDFIRILFAHLGVAYCPETGDKIQSISKEYVLDRILALPEGNLPEGNLPEEKITILAPISLKQESFSSILTRFSQEGYLRIRLNGTYYEIDEEIPFEPYRKNELFLVIDRLVIKAQKTTKNHDRILEAITRAATVSSGIVIVSCRDKDFYYNLAFAVESTGKSYPPITPKTFSFNSEEGMCPECQGIGSLYGINLSDTRSLMKLSIVDCMHLLLKKKTTKKAINLICNYFEKFKIDPFEPLKELKKQSLDLFLKGSSKSIYQTKDKLRISFKGLEPTLAKAAKRATTYLREELIPLMYETKCPECEGARLNPLARNVKLNKHTILEICEATIQDALTFFKSIQLSSAQKKFLEETLESIISHLEFLCEIGLDYLSLSRSAPTLSGGEMQRIRLAKQLGGGLTNCIYVLDEPTIGLHPHNNTLLIQSLKKLHALNNTLLIVEHDPAMIKLADHIVDFGPEAGTKGGQITFEGSFKKILKSKTSLTGKYLSQTKKIPIPTKKRSPDQFLHVEKASIHNLQNIDISFPVSCMTCITGVSGSGKSSLIEHVIKPGIEAALKEKKGIRSITLPYAKLTNLQHFDKLIVIDQTPFGLTARADVLTYSDMSKYLRSFFASLSLAKVKGLQPRHFSYNHKRGMCRNCWGLGYKTVDLQYMPSVQVTCDACSGNRLNPISLEVTYKNKHFGQILQLTIDEATEFFANIPSIMRKLHTLLKVGLGYLQIGQAIATLSGGELQRLRLAKELSKRSTGKTLYLIDEPTTGLHFTDIEKLLKIFHALADKKNTLIFVEHHLDLIANCDYIIDLGPGAGKKGGKVVASGSIDQIMKTPSSLTGKYLKKHLLITS